MARIRRICWLTGIALLFSLTGCTTLCVNSDDGVGNLLPQERIKELREEYPLSTNTPATISMREVSFREVMTYGDGVVVAEVMKVLPNFRVELTTDPGTPERKMADKDRANGVTPYQPEFISYQVKVHEVVTGDHVAEDTFLFYNADFAGMEPELKPGMKIIAVVKRGRPENSWEDIRSPAMAHTILLMLTTYLPPMRENLRNYVVSLKKRMASSWTLLWIKSRTSHKAKRLHSRRAAEYSNTYNHSLT
ncbi:hypothetical protein P9222_06045 [Paenibacillus amylolyticus]|nr:hypothetical protein [Paenibacillus amylolyticus]WFR63816.1 hypothetical protein P9222_06045 [Paenibacillus amylolyticus]